MKLQLDHEIKCMSNKKQGGPLREKSQNTYRIFT